MITVRDHMRATNRGKASPRRMDAELASHIKYLEGCRRVASQKGWTEMVARFDARIAAARASVQS